MLSTATLYEEALHRQWNCPGMPKRTYKMYHILFTIHFASIFPQTLRLWALLPGDITQLWQEFQTLLQCPLELALH